MDSPSFGPDDLIDLIERLRLAGFKVGASRHINAQNLLLLLASRGHLDDAPERLATWLAPVLCSSPEEQTAFYELFKKWSDDRRAKLPRRTPRGSLLRDTSLWAAVLIVFAIGVVIVAIILLNTRPGGVQPNPAPTPNIVPQTTGGLLWFFGGVVALFALVMGWLFLKSPRDARLVRSRAEKNLSLERLSVKGTGERLFGGGLHALRGKKSIASNDLDVNPTVNATARNAGWFTPIYSFKSTTPEYLLLIDSVDYGDHQAEFGEALYKRLQEECAITSRYFFRSDPRLCRSDDPTAPHLTLEELTSLHPEHELIIIGDGEGLLDPLTGRPARWLSSAPRWQTHVLLTPMPRQFWGYRERALVQEGFVVIPANSSGLDTLAERSTVRALAEPERAGWRPRYPEELKRRPGRWLMDEEPAPELLKRVCFQLRLFLGTEGYQWLCACAVFPVLLWDLTLYLGRGVELDSVFEENLSKLVQLPWFRHGFMPDWLRLKLINDLDPRREQEVRQALNDLLLSCDEKGVCDPVELEILVMREEPRARLAQGNKILRCYVEANPESLLRDYLLLTFMSGQKPDRLAVDVPAEVLERLAVQGDSNRAVYTLDVLLLALAYYILFAVTQSPSVVGIVLGMMTVLCDLILVFQLHQWGVGDMTRVLRSVMPRPIPEKVVRPAEKHPKQLYIEKHPKQLYVLSAIQMCERFNAYSLRTILLLYMVGDAPNGFGWKGEQVSRLYYLFIFSIGAAMIPGGWLSDRRFFGYRRSLAVGGLILFVGYVLLVLHSVVALYAALVCLVVGSGLFRPSATVMVGELYAEGSRLKDRAYTIFELGINIAMFVGWVVSTLVSVSAGYGPAFSVSAGGMLVSLIILLFLKGRPESEGDRVLPRSTASEGGSSSEVSDAPRIAGREQPSTEIVPTSRRVFALTTTFAVAILLEALGIIANLRFSIFTENNTTTRMTPVALTLLIWLWVVVIPLPLVWLWGWLARRDREPSTPTKMTLGVALVGCSCFVMSLAGRAGGDAGKVSSTWLISAYSISALGGMMFSPMVLAMVSKIAPRRVRGLVMGGLLAAMTLTYMLSFVSVNWNAGVHSNVFALFGTTALVGAAILLALVRRLKRAIPPVGDVNVWH